MKRRVLGAVACSTVLGTVFTQTTFGQVTNPSLGYILANQGDDGNIGSKLVSAYTAKALTVHGFNPSEVSRGGASLLEALIDQVHVFLSQDVTTLARLSTSTESALEGEVTAGIRLAEVLKQVPEGVEFVEPLWNKTADLANYLIQNGWQYSNFLIAALRHLPLSGGYLELRMRLEQELFHAGHPQTGWRVKKTDAATDLDSTAAGHLAYQGASMNRDLYRRNPDGGFGVGDIRTGESSIETTLIVSQALGEPVSTGFLFQFLKPDGAITNSGRSRTAVRLLSTSQALTALVN